MSTVSKSFVVPLADVTMPGETPEVSYVRVQALDGSNAVVESKDIQFAPGAVSVSGSFAALEANAQFTRRSVGISYVGGQIVEIGTPRYVPFSTVADVTRTLPA